MITATQVQENMEKRSACYSTFFFLAQVAVLGFLISVSANAQEAGNKLQEIQVQNLPGDKVELQLHLSGPAPEPLAFTIDQPARIALDLPDTSLGLDSRRTDVGIGALDTILAAEANGRTRVVLNLDDLVGYETRVAGNIIYVTLDSVSSGQPAVTEFAAAETTDSPAATERGIESIDFRRTDAGGGRIIVVMTDASTPVDVSQESGRVVVNFSDTELADELLKRLDVLDFATPVSTIDVLKVNDDARLVISAQGEFEELAYQSDRTFTVEIQPVARQDEKAIVATLFSGNKEYTGERLTLNFQDIDARAVLQLLADISGRNIVVSDTVSGNVTLRLQNVPWDQAMDIVLATKGLDMRENGNVIIVAPAAEIAAREKADLEARKEIEQLEPLYSEFLQVNYAKASDIASLIGKGGDNSLLSTRGTVAIDDRTNTLLLKDTADHIADIRRLVAKLDIPVRQVLIESRIVVVNDDFSRDLGIRWGFTGITDRSDGLVAVSGNASGTDTIVQSGIDNINNGDPLFPVALPALADRLNVNMPVANPAGSFALAILDDDYLVDLELSAAQAEGNGEVISSPRVITANQKEAKIQQGVEIPYREASSSGATTTQFKDAVLSLTVTPQITPDDRIIMDLYVTKDSVGEQVSDGFGGSVPSIDTRSVQTQVLVDNGQTVVLGGIYETEKGEQVTKVPFLGDIPFLGALFRSTRAVSNKSELLIFVTPKILNEGSAIY
jgi:type IV pilus assembly protein PilQ